MDTDQDISLQGKDDEPSHDNGDVNNESSKDGAGIGVVNAEFFGRGTVTVMVHMESAELPCNVPEYNRNKMMPSKGDNNGKHDVVKAKVEMEIKCLEQTPEGKEGKAGDDEKEHVNSPQYSTTDITTNNVNKEIGMDEALLTIGCGRFQILTQILLTYVVLTVGYQATMSYFIGDDPPWRCNNSTVTNSTSFCQKHIGQVFRKNDTELFSRRCQLHRNEWSYVTPKDYSYVTEFDLVCAKSSIADFASSIYHIGGMGIFVAGLLADNIGRKYVLIFILSMLASVSVGCSFVASHAQLIVLRAFLGMGTVSCFNITYNYLSELISPNKRTLGSVIYGTGFAVSQLLIDALATKVKKWRRLQLYSTFPCLLAIILLFFMPESPRWQLVNKKKQKAEEALQKISKFNKTDVSAATTFSLREPPKQSHQRRYTYIDLFVKCRVALVTLSQALIWMTIEMCYYTIALESSSLGVDMYEAFMLSALAEIPSTIVACFTCVRYGRKKTCLAGLIGAAVCMVATASFQRPTFNMVMMMLGKFFINLSEQAVYMWTFELFPTVIRFQGTSVCILCARIGSFGAPFLSNTIQNMNRALPYIIMSSFAVVSTLCGFFLPETNRQPTRENYEDFFRRPVKENSVHVSKNSENNEQSL